MYSLIVGLSLIYGLFVFKSCFLSIEQGNSGVFVPPDILSRECGWTNAIEVWSPSLFPAACLPLALSLARSLVHKGTHFRSHKLQLTSKWCVVLGMHALFSCDLCQSEAFTTITSARSTHSCSFGCLVEERRELCGWSLPDLHLTSSPSHSLQVEQPSRRLAIHLKLRKVWH